MGKRRGRSDVGTDGVDGIGEEVREKGVDRQ